MAWFVDRVHNLTSTTPGLALPNPTNGKISAGFVLVQGRGHEFLNLIPNPNLVPKPPIKTYAFMYFHPLSNGK